jgi:hypothetical protein
MKYNLLRIVQKILSSLDADEVNTIAGTVESLQVAEIVEDVYYNMFTNKIIPEHYELLKVEALADGDRPNYLRLPSSVARIEWVKYNITDDPVNEREYREICYLEPEVFLNRIMGRSLSDSNVIEVIDISGVPLLIKDDADPSFWTSFDDDYMVFDSYDKTVDSTLQTSKSMVWGRIVPEFSLEDTFEPDIDDNLFPTLINESKSWAHAELKQASHQKAEQQSRKQRTLFQNDRHRIKRPYSRPDYGRRR